MKEKRRISTRIVVLLLAAALVCGGAIGGTVAWLVASSDTVTNTFTVGDINIELAETTGETYKIVPGGSSAKDPTITVKSGSESCYVYAKITNTVILPSGTAPVATPVLASGWTEIGKNGNVTLYRYDGNPETTDDIVDASTEDQKLPVLTSVTYSADIAKEDISNLANTKIEVTGYAHQSANTDQATADAAAKNWAGITTTGQ